MGYKMQGSNRKKIGGKYFYFLHGYAPKSVAVKEAQRIRKLGHGVRIIRGTGQLAKYYYLYTTSKTVY